jgi:hypothetical protein
VKSCDPVSAPDFDKKWKGKEAEKVGKRIKGEARSARREEMRKREINEPTARRERTVGREREWVEEKR